MRLLKEAGLDAIDVDLMPGGFLTGGKGWETLSDEEVMELIRPCKEAAQKNGIAISQAHGGLSWFQETTPERQALQQRVLKLQIKLCDFLDCPRLILHPAYLPYDQQTTAEDAREVNLDLLTQLIPTLKQYPVTVCIENCFIRNQGKTLECTCSSGDIIDYIDELNIRAGQKCFAYCLDTGHALLVGANIGDLIRKIGHRLEALHMNDNDGVDDRHTLPFTGLVDWQRMAEALRDVGYHDSLNFEVNLGPRQLYPETLRYLAAVGRMFEQIILNDR